MPTRWISGLSAIQVFGHRRWALRNSDTPRDSRGVEGFSEFFRRNDAFSNLGNARRYVALGVGHGWFVLRGGRKSVARAGAYDGPDPNRIRLWRLPVERTAGWRRSTPTDDGRP